MAFLAGPPTPGPGATGAGLAPSAAAAAGAAAAALLQRQLLQGSGGGGDAGWSEHQTGDGRKFYHNEETQTSQWEKPEALMSQEERSVNTASWRQYRIWDGRVFYYNKETKVSCWSMPPDLRKLRGESTGLDDRPLLDTAAEKRRAFGELLQQKGLDSSWDWRRVEEASSGAPEAEGVSEQVRKQCFVEQLSLAMKMDSIKARAKERNAAVALERLIEERFSQPEDSGTTYEDAARLLGDEEPWLLIKSEVRRDEVFQAVMERLEEKHQKARAEKRTERVVRLQRLIATDPELRRNRLRWKDAAAVLARRDELQEEDPPIEALRVWASLRDLRQTSELEKAKALVDPAVSRDERRRRDVFRQAIKELAAGELVKLETSWAEVEAMVETDQRYTALREGQGATAMELFDEFLEDLRVNGPAAYAGATPAALPGVPETAKVEVVEPPAKRQRLFEGAAEPIMVKKEEPAAEDAGEEEDDTNALDALIAAARGLEDEEDGAAAKQEIEEDDDATEDEEDDPLMGAALKAAEARRLAAEASGGAA
mmetsp:Transcript_73471/g.132300  ORF Transcript_73471/g.132300 Transcript_73471/m.132300 type:complete len:541 (-) Transcript_73471:163-1785(-)